jgi:hypothetical protein
MKRAGLRKGPALFLAGADRLASGAHRGRSRSRRRLWSAIAVRDTAGNMASGEIERLAKIEAAIRQERLERLAFVEGLPGAEAKRIAANIRRSLEQDDAARRAEQSVLREMGIDPDGLDTEGA